MEESSSESSQYKFLALWRELEAHMRNVPSKDRFRNFRRCRDCFTGTDAVTHILAFLHKREEPKYRGAGRENATTLASKLMNQGLFIAINDLDPFADTDKFLYRLVVKEDNKPVLTELPSPRRGSMPAIHSKLSEPISPAELSNSFGSSPDRKKIYVRSTSTDEHSNDFSVPPTTTTSTITTISSSLSSEVTMRERIGPRSPLKNLHHLSHPASLPISHPASAPPLSRLLPSPTPLQQTGVNKQSKARESGNEGQSKQLSLQQFLVSLGDYDEDDDNDDYDERNQSKETVDIHSSTLNRPLSPSNSSQKTANSPSPNAIPFDSLFGSTATTTTTATTTATTMPSRSSLEFDRSPSIRMDNVEIRIQFLENLVTVAKLLRILKISSKSVLEFTPMPYKPSHDETKYGYLFGRSLALYSDGIPPWLPQITAHLEKYSSSGEVTRGLKVFLPAGATIFLNGLEECAATIRKFMSRLPSPILPQSFHPIFAAIGALQSSNENESLRALQLTLSLLPLPHSGVFRFLCHFWHNLAQNSAHNGMDSKYLAHRFTPLLCGAATSAHEKSISFVIHRCIHSPTACFQDCESVMKEVREEADGLLLLYAQNEMSKTLTLLEPLLNYLNPNLLQARVEHTRTETSPLHL